MEYRWLQTAQRGRDGAEELASDCVDSGENKMSVMSSEAALTAFKNEKASQKL
jgi:hypothetical protein